MSLPPLPPIKFADLAAALLAQADSLLAQWLPGGSVKGHEYFVHSVWRDEKTPSLSVRLQGNNAGRWQDHGGDRKGGDLLSLYAAINSLDQGQAALQLARQLGLEDVAGVRRAGADYVAPPAAVQPKAPAKVVAISDKETWTAEPVVPAHAPAPTFWHFEYKSDKRQAPIDHQAEYRRDADLFGYVLRFLKTDGGKEPLPHTWCTGSRDGGSAWKWKQFAEPRPLYLPLGTLAADTTVVLVEGEKKAGVLQDLLQAGAPGVYTVASWPGGGKAWSKANWQWLAGRTVLLWPDCDGQREALSTAERDATPDVLARQVLQQAKPIFPADKQPGMKAMMGIGAHLRDAHGCTVSMLAIPAPGAVESGWDCADAINTDGWDFARVLAFFGTAAPLVADGAETKKIERPVNTVGGDHAGGGGHGGDGGGEGGEGGDDDDREPAWLMLYWDDKKKFWRTSRKLVIAALTHDALLAPVLGLNELSNNIECRQPWPWAGAKVGQLKGVDDLRLGAWLTERYGLPSIPRAALMEAIESVAHARPFHPVRQYLHGLKWDGVERINKWLMYVLGETPASMTKPRAEYLSLVGRYWLLGMVHRVMQPGCKFDYCPVLEGPGGLGKSTLVEVLAGTAFYSDTHFDVARGKEGQEQVQGLWLYEIAELANFGKAEIGLIKAFITAKVDRYRPSYGRTVESYQRQCVLVGTTNENTYLRDRTGNRRFWPVPVRERIKLNWLRKWRELLLAEAYQLYQEGAAYTPSHEEEARLFVPMQARRLMETAVTSALREVLTRNPVGNATGMVVNNLTKFVTMAQLVLALGTDAAKSAAGLEGQIKTWMEYEGWVYSKKQINGVRAHGWTRPEKWPATDIDADAEFDDLPMPSQTPAQPDAPGAADQADAANPPDQAKPANPYDSFYGDADDAPF
jgi:putative DNA primase/helicase